MKSHRLGSLRSEAGQGTIEYILVITVTVILFLTVIYQFNDAFRSYAEQFFDGYVACLLETGELPGHGDCKAEMKKFNVADGKPLLKGPLGNGDSGSGSGGGTGSGGSGSGSGSGSGGKDGKDSSGSAASGGKKGGGSGSGGGGGSESSPSGGENSVAVGSIGSRRSGRQASTAVAQNKDENGEGGKDSLIAPLPGMTGGSSDSAGGRARKTALDRDFGYMNEEQKAEEAKTRAPVQAVTTKNEMGDDLRSNKTRVEASRKTASVQVDDGGGFTFGGLIRIVLITGIILAIVVFMGGQLMQISKSYEK